jgi:putative hydrolase of the HAD superfamily
VITAVLFDLDDTLFDHRQTSRAALRALRDRHAVLQAVTLEAFEAAHAVHLEELHREVMLGRMPLEAARVERFRRLFASLDATACAADEAAATYRAAYRAARRPVAGAVALLERLHGRVGIGIVSNNLLAEQVEKIRCCGFEPHVDALVVSEDVGVAKPDPRIFRIALERLGCGPGEALMVGDSWSADVLGARAAGLRGLWFNPHGLACPEPDFSDAIASLEPADTLAASLIGRAIDAA